MFPTADTEEISQVTSENRNTSLSRDAQDSPENPQVAKQNNNRELTVNMLIKEFVFCIALALTTYGALHNTPTKVSKHPQAVRFFEPHSIVVDWYRGQLSSALEAVNRADVAFVMYYAPWDAESQHVRGEFERAALVLKDRVYFSAINCWNPGSECRVQHNKIPSWPILIVYTVNSRGILYKGLRDAHSMVKFLELIMKPLERVSTTEDLVTLLSTCDAVALGFTPLSKTSKHYNAWYNAALKAREFDTVGEICFAVATSEEFGVDLGVDHFPNVRLMLWNETKEYVTKDYNHTWNESSLVHWVLENFAQPVARVIPMWKKSFSFEKYIDGNPILILFTPLNLLYEQAPVYSLMREVAMEYYNCYENETFQWTVELTKLQAVQRLFYQQKNYMRFCKDYKFKNPVRKPSKFYKKEVVSHNNKWFNTTQKNKKSSVFNLLLKRGLALSKMFGSDDVSDVTTSLGLLQQCSNRILPAEKSYDQYDFCQSIEDLFEHEAVSESENKAETTMLPLEDDPFSPENLIQDNLKHFCDLIKFAAEFGPPIYPAKVGNTTYTNIQGLSCTTNFTLHVLAVDSVRNHHFAESLGIDIANKKDMTTAVILDSKHESQYVLSEEFSAKSIRDFIRNFTRRSLKRSLRSHVATAAHTHFYNSVRSGPSDDNAVYITELTTDTFRTFVNTPGTVSLVLVCGGGCGAPPPPPRSTRAATTCPRTSRRRACPRCSSPLATLPTAARRTPARTPCRSACRPAGCWRSCCVPCPRRAVCACASPCATTRRPQRKRKPV